ncbi:hypothetical protein JCGZ_00554 [Jatropha curcas]|uniref:FAS1 domain-containing protein n=1 Tax=Jatropha curcas TaxID=180498 RepID=A0A067JD84_JATCU|nr:FAS1 domain-containing protein SELMODRAFT_448915 [Jatropha curcas]KDP21767.1 hypothetical protein JCGZ_00554 [Jatropha curcas]
MATYLKLLLLLSSLLSAIATDITSRSHELDVAIEEMTTANYFTFVTLINMAPFDNRIQENITFLMPNDKILSKTGISQDSVSDFLLRHSIPSPLIFEHLQHIPSGSRIPSSKPDYMLDINNNGGRRSFFLNNVKIISPNICTAGFSIRCHGIDAVLVDINNNTLSSCSNASAPPVVVGAPPPVSALLPPLPPAAVAPSAIASDQIPVVADNGPKKSGSSMSFKISLKFTFIFVVISIIWFNI